MSSVIPQHFLTFGPLGEERIARGNAIRAEHGAGLIQDSNHQYAKLCPRWTPLVVSMRRVKTASGGITEEWEGITNPTTSFERVAWTTYKPQKDRLNHTMYFDFEGGQVRFRTRPELGVWSAYTTSPVHGARATWTQAITFVDTSIHQIEVDLLGSIASVVTPGRLFAAVWVEDVGSL